MAQFPDIKPDVNREPDREKKGAGFFARLFGGGAGTGTAGLGASGVAGGGVMATKAGLLALILVGSTVAGGIGLAGYRLFGPGSDENSDKNFTLFAARPKDKAADADAAGAATKDANSQSLHMFNKANTAASSAEGKPGETSAGDVASTSGADSSASASRNNAGSEHSIGADTTSNGVHKGLLKAGSKFGEMSKSFGSGSGAPVVTSANPGNNAASSGSGAAARSGTLSGMKRGVAAVGGAGRAVASRMGAQSGVRNAMGVLGDHRGATTSYGAGRTYDGSAAPAGVNPGGGNDIGMGPGANAATQAKSSPNTAANSKEFKAPPTPSATMAAPWQNAIDTAKSILLIAAVIMMLGYMLRRNPYFKAIKMYLAALVCVLGVAVIALGAQIAGGEYGQKAQGAVLGAAGLGLTIMGAAMLMDGDKSTFKNENTLGTEAGVKGAEATGVGGVTPDKTFVGPPEANAPGPGGEGLFGMNPMVAIGGGIAVMGLIGTMMMPPQKYPSSTFANGQPPDARFF